MGPMISILGEIATLDQAGGGYTPITAQIASRQRPRRQPFNLSLPAALGYFRYVHDHQTRPRDINIECLLLEVYHGDSRLIKLSVLFDAGVQGERACPGRIWFWIPDTNVRPWPSAASAVVPLTIAWSLK